MARAWLTPSEMPDGNTCRAVLIPDGDEWLAAFRGALLLLADSNNWEPFGSVTPEQAAARWLETFDHFLQNQECGEGMQSTPAVFEYSLSNGTHAGSASVGVNYIPLNFTLVPDAANNVESLPPLVTGDPRTVYDRLILSPGTYLIEWEAQANRVGPFRSLIETDVLTFDDPIRYYGLSTRSGTNDFVHAISSGLALIEISQERLLWLCVDCSNSRADNGLGFAVARSGNREIYGRVKVYTL